MYLLIFVNVSELK